MYRGRWQLGQEVPLGCVCVDGSDTPALPDAAPAMTVLSEAGAVVLSRLVPVMDRYQATGYFHLRQFLGTQFATGMYRVTYHWTIGGTTYSEEDVFEIVAGGNDQGTVIAMTHYARPHARYLVQQLDSGRLVQGRNPSI